MERTADVIAVVEAGYCLDGDEQTWLRRIVAAAGRVIGGASVAIVPIGSDPVAAFARGVDPEGAEVLLVAAAFRATRRDQIRWGRVASHLATALRLRRRAALGAAPEAEITPDG